MTFETKMRKQASKMQRSVGDAVPGTRQASEWLKTCCAVCWERHARGAERHYGHSANLHCWLTPMLAQASKWLDTIDDGLIQ